MIVVSAFLCCCFHRACFIAQRWSEIGMRFLILFVTLPLIELYVLIEVGSDIGGLATILLCLATAFLGGILIRLQGLGMILRAQRELAQGQPPAETVLHGLMLAVSGVFLFVPGFVTDVLGFLLLVPSVRSWVLAWFVLRRMQSRQTKADDNLTL